MSAFSHLDHGSPGGGSALHPDWFKGLYSVTEIVGGGGPLDADGELRCGTLSMPPGLLYPAHRHPAPELYVVLSGSLRWTVDGEATREVGPGVVILHRPDQSHAMETSTHSARLLWVWWAPGGDRAVLTAPAASVDPWEPPL